MNKYPSLRGRIGALAREGPRFVWGLRPWWFQAGGGGAWTRIRNRDDRLETGPEGVGQRCCRQWTSELNFSRQFPAAGRALLRRALMDWPVGFGWRSSEGGRPQVSFIVTWRGRERLPQLLATLESLAAQRGVSVEIVLVEQDEAPAALPRQNERLIRVQSAPPTPGMPFCRAWGFNVGASHARADILVFHDGDMLAPAKYAAEVVRQVDRGFEVVNLKRFVFYLSERATARTLQFRTVALEYPPLAVIQNLEAGGSVALTREALGAIGGFDEAFVGWGGEDNELWERCQTLRVFGWGYLPIVHLWHPEQPEKALGAQAPTRALYEALSGVPVEDRIRSLRLRPHGRREGPTPASMRPDSQ
jgi:hypothetical protein